LQIPRLHPNTIEEVKQRADIVDVISNTLFYANVGKTLGLCPSTMKNSLFQSTKQMYYCFGCNAGEMQLFLMELGKRPFAEVVLDLHDATKCQCKL